jgi:hypothetical protein
MSVSNDNAKRGSRNVILVRVIIIRKTFAKFFPVIDFELVNGLPAKLLWCFHIAIL